MAKKIKFPLKMKNGAEVRTFDELKENFDLESVLGYFADKRLATWLADRYYDEKAKAVLALSSDTPDLNAKICEILEVEYKVEEDSTDLKFIQRRNEKLRILSAFTDNKEVLKNIDIVAMDQNELFDILDDDPEIVYLYGEKFDIPFGKKNVCYTGVNNPLVILEKEMYVSEYIESGITFKNVQYEEQATKYLSKGEELYIDNKYDEAIPYIKEAAENGNPRAMYILAMSYKDGTGVESNRILCCEWLNRANGLGEPLSMMNYACFCCNNETERTNILSEYSELLKKLADSGDVLAQYEYGNYLCSYTDDKKAIGVLLLKEVALKGFVPAMFSLGISYYHGDGVEKNEEKGIEWYLKAAEHGYARAQYRLAIHYTPKLESKGMSWGNPNYDKENYFILYRSAAVQGYASAQYMCAEIIKITTWGSVWNIQNRAGFAEEKNVAFEWYKKAAQQGHTEAQCELGGMYRFGYGVTKDDEKAIEWYQKSAEQGYAKAQFNLAEMYHFGHGVARSISLALEWYQKAAEQGYESARDRIKRLGTGVYI